MAAGAAASANPGVAGAPVTATSGGLEPHIAAALSYTPFGIGLIASIIFLLVAPFNQNKFVRFSAFQSLFLHLGVFVLFVAVGIVATMMTLLLHLFGALFVFIYPLLWIGVLIMFLFMMYKAFNNEKLKLPFIGDLAEKQA
jgi:uncharacterized membrane protein